mmetsp:Transcript_7303/g.24258  ORF Transcript_7303/g.24258 Transcript_7303/m.24258 type:complete len:615 (-) Transcript_7303:15-1859(-)
MREGVVVLTTRLAARRRKVEAAAEHVHPDHRKHAHDNAKEEKEAHHRVDAHKDFVQDILLRIVLVSRKVEAMCAQKVQVREGSRPETGDGEEHDNDIEQLEGRRNVPFEPPNRKAAQNHFDKKDEGEDKLDHDERRRLRVPVLEHEEAHDEEVRRVDPVHPRIETRALRKSGEDHGHGHHRRHLHRLCRPFRLDTLVDDALHVRRLSGSGDSLTRRLRRLARFDCSAHGCHEGVWGGCRPVRRHRSPRRAASRHRPAARSQQALQQAGGSLLGLVGSLDESRVLLAQTQKHAGDGRHKHVDEEVRCDDDEADEVSGARLVLRGHDGVHHHVPVLEAHALEHGEQGVQKGVEVCEIVVEVGDAIRAVEVVPRESRRVWVEVHVDARAHEPLPVRVVVRVAAVQLRGGEAAHWVVAAVVRKARHHHAASFEGAAEQPDAHQPVRNAHNHRHGDDVHEQRHRLAQSLHDGDNGAHKLEGAQREERAKHAQCPKMHPHSLARELRKEDDPRRHHDEQIQAVESLREVGVRAPRKPQRKDARNRLHGVQNHDADVQNVERCVVDILPYPLVLIARLERQNHAMNQYQNHNRVLRAVVVQHVENLVAHGVLLAKQTEALP